MFEDHLAQLTFLMAIQIICEDHGLDKEPYAVAEKHILSRGTEDQVDQLVKSREVTLHVHGTKLRNVELQIFPLIRVEVGIYSTVLKLSNGARLVSVEINETSDGIILIKILEAFSSFALNEELGLYCVLTIVSLIHI